MSLSKSFIQSGILWISLLLLLLSPMLANHIGVPRLDTGLAGAYFVLGLVTLISVNIDKRILLSIVIFLFIFSFGILSTLLSFSIQKVLDVFFFGYLIFLYLYLYLFLDNKELDKNIRMLLLVLISIILIAFVIEFVFGFQFVSGNEELSILDEAYKGLFFNTNDQAVVIASLAAVVSFFYILDQKDRKIRLIGYFLLSLAGMVVFVSASRAALLSYLMMVFLVLFLNANKFLKMLYVFFAFVISLFLFNLEWLEQVLYSLTQISWLERPAERVLLALFSLDQDQSVGYRTEIYTAFVDNFKVIWLGYGPRDYAAYFDKIPLSYGLGYTNPHSLFIEIYLAFGFFGFVLFILFILYSFFVVFTSRAVNFSQKVFSTFVLTNFCWLVWVPSSVFRLPIVWLPVFLIVIFCVVKEYNYKNKDNVIGLR
ncbi:O-antigen ligase family protein [Glaesserella sp.]|uniref:O-antigen ligase family protein n=1 Tax=Glaesserella sp. TaxID=2094731 RepID=UPI0035A05D14